MSEKSKAVDCREIPKTGVSGQALY